MLGDAYAEFDSAVHSGRELLRGRVIWNINSTPKGGGVAEMLRSLIAYANGAGVDTRWLVIQGEPGFFLVTKRIHNRLHGAPGDGGPLGPNERKIYDQTVAPNADALAELISPGDIVILHDPQTAGLCNALKQTGAVVVWRCHVGLDTPNPTARGAWDFIRPFLSSADAYVFSRPAFVWDDLADEKIAIIPPSIDAFSPKNQDMSAEWVDVILDAAGVIKGAKLNASPTFTRMDGSHGMVVNRAVTTGGSEIFAGVKIVVQVSRWDRLKDPLGVMIGFADQVALVSDAHLVLAGPAVEQIADDPEGAEVHEEVQQMWETFDPQIRDRIHLVSLPMEDDEENAAVVNALQRKADVVVQKSLAEGFGLTVAEGMWKSRPVVASRIGGIQDQIEDRISGLLLDDPSDREEFGTAVLSLLRNPERAAAMGTAARERVRAGFLGPRHLMQYLDLFARLIG